MSIYRVGLCLCICLFFADFNNASAAERTGSPLKVQVDMAHQSGKPVSPNLFGANLLFWIDDDVFLANPALRTGLQQAGIRLLRFPGGTVADNYLWKENRLVRRDRFPYEDGDQTTDWREFIAFAKAINAEPVLVVNTETFVRDGRVQEGAAYAAEWVRACNVEGNYKVTYWEIGNETYWHETMTAKEYARVVRIYAEAMRAVDPNIKLGVNGHWNVKMVGSKERIHPGALAEIAEQNRLYSGREGGGVYKALVDKNSEKDIMAGDEKWWPTVIAGCGDAADFLIIHCYFTHGSSLLGLDLNLQAVRHLYQKTWPGRPVDLAMTEYNAVAKYDENKDGKSYATGLADSVIQMLRAEVEMAMFWPLRISGDWNGRALMNRSTMQPKIATSVLSLFSQTAGKHTAPVTGTRGEIMGVAAFGKDDWSLYFSDFGLKTTRNIQVQLPQKWNALRAEAYSENESGKKSVLNGEAVKMIQTGQTLLIAMRPNTIIKVNGDK